MGKFRLFVPLLCLSLLGCNRQQRMIPAKADSTPMHVDKLQATESSIIAGQGALISTRFKSFEELKTVIQIEYVNGAYGSDSRSQGDTWVRLSHCSSGREVIGQLRSGVNDNDFLTARDGDLWDRFRLALRSPYAVVHRRDLQGAYILARRREDLFGEGDPAFYDVAAAVMHNISETDSVFMHSKDITSEKGYFNTVNHITAQAFTTSIFSERLADFIADVHERKNLPELVNGKFTDAQLADLDEGPVDNYVDMINNEWGQELGKRLRKKHHISRETRWTPELLARYLNDIQRYYSWAFQIGFKPFRPDDEVVIKFSFKLNSVMHDGLG